MALVTQEGGRSLSMLSATVPCGLWQIEQSLVNRLVLMDERPAFLRVALIASVDNAVALHERAPDRASAIVAIEQTTLPSGIGWRNVPIDLGALLLVTGVADLGLVTLVKPVGRCIVWQLVQAVPRAPGARLPSQWVRLLPAWHARQVAFFSQAAWSCCRIPDYRPTPRPPPSFTCCGGIAWQTRALRRVSRPRLLPFCRGLDPWYAATLSAWQPSACLTSRSLVLGVALAA
jgi:hypothetical protein